MSHIARHSSIGFPAEPKRNQRINNPIKINAVNYGKTVENNNFRQNKYIYAVQSRILLKTQDRAHQKLQEPKLCVRRRRSIKQVSAPP